MKLPLRWPRRLAMHSHTSIPSTQQRCAQIPPPKQSPPSRSRRTTSHNGRVVWPNEQPQKFTIQSGHARRKNTARCLAWQAVRLHKGVTPIIDRALFEWLPEWLGYRAPQSLRLAILPGMSHCATPHPLKRTGSPYPASSSATVLRLSYEPRHNGRSFSPARAASI